MREDDSKNYFNLVQRRERGFRIDFLASKVKGSTAVYGAGPIVLCPQWEDCDATLCI